MKELETSRFTVAAPLFAALAAHHLSIEAVLSGVAPGRVLVDDTAAPTVAVLHGPEGVYLGGMPQGETLAADLAGTIDGWAYLYVPQFGGQYARALPHPYMLEHPRLTFRIATARFDAPPILPAGVAVESTGEAGRAIVVDGETVSTCEPDMIVGDRAEIGVWTHPDFRRRGLASFACRASLAAARRQGISVVGWHCHASNRASVSLARALGGRDGTPTFAYSASLPAENPGDLGQEEMHRLAVHFERAAAAIAWMDFHTACAWAQAGETGRALDAVERLVANEWAGDPQWLAGHWTLAGLRPQRRFAAALAALEGARRTV